MIYDAAGITLFNDGNKTPTPKNMTATHFKEYLSPKDLHPKQSEKVK